VTVSDRGGSGAAGGHGRWRPGGGRRGKIPYVQQTTPTDCGAACLAMVLGHFGYEARLAEIREITGYGSGGTQAARLLEAARRFGLRGRGLQADGIEDLELVPRGAILHWRFNHFVVFDRLTARHVEIVDPATGPRRVPRAEVSREFTGVALAFEPSEEFRPGGDKSGTRRAGSYLRRILSHSGLLTRILTTSVLVHGFTLTVPLLIGLLVDRVAPERNEQLLWILGVGLLAIIAFHLAASLVRSHLLLHLRTKLDAQMTLDFLDHMVNLPYSFFQKRSAGDLMMRLNSNSTIRELLTSGMLSAVLDGVLVFLYLVFVFTASARMGVLIVLLGLVRIGIFLATRKRHRDLMSQSLHHQATSQSYQVQLLAGIETLKAAGAEERAAGHWANLFVDVLNVSLRRGRLDAWVQSSLSTLAVGSPLVILFYGGHLVLAGQISLGTMLAVVALGTGFLQPLSTLVETGLQLQLMGSYLDRVDDVLGTPREQERARRPRTPRLRGRIILDGVSFRYEPLLPLVVDDVSVEVEPGRSVAVVGRSGAGKSTLARLLVGLYRPTEGRILFDGHDLAELDLREVRSQIGVVPQHPFLFGHSIRSNIALTDPGLRLAQVVDAARRAQLHREILAMPMGYETLLADGGASLSGGQRQRMAIARALAGRPRILLLDEATSSLDAISEARIHRELESLRATRIIIAHRLSTIRGADQILVMDAGRIVERGDHESLVERKGLYHELVTEQVERGPRRARPGADASGERLPAGPRAGSA
jgi:ATP-binding cassette, subfamily B, bacterial